MELGRQIMNYRKKAAMTQEMLAKQLNISNQAVSKWEANQSYPDIMLLSQLADIFEITLDELFGRTVKDEQGICKAQDLPWEEDGELRAVIYLGKQLCKHEQLTRENQIICDKVKFQYEGAALCVESAFCVECGTVEGDVQAGGSVSCANVEGDVIAGTQVACNVVEGNVTAGLSVQCGDVEGDVRAGFTVNQGPCDL